MEAQILIGFEGRAYHARDFYASQFLATVLGGGMSSRLFQEIREKRGLCYSIHAFHWGFSDTGIFGIHAATGEEDITELVPVILEQLQEAASHINQQEVDRARAQVAAGLLMSLESPAARAGQTARQILLFGRPIPNEELLERLDAITPARLSDLAGRLIGGSIPTVAAIGPIGPMMGQMEIAERLGSTPQIAAQ
jgi:predicted Zn-dependent peptidase